MFSDTAERGTVVFNGSSFGAFTINGGLVSFPNAQTIGYYDSVVSFDSTYFDPTQPANATPIYLNEPGNSGDVELDIAPVTIAMWLPSTITYTVGDPGGVYEDSNTTAPPGATLINFTGLPSGSSPTESFEITYLGAP